MKSKMLLFFLLACSVKTIAQDSFNLIERYEMDTSTIMSEIRTNLLQSPLKDDSMEVYLMYAFWDTCSYQVDDYLDYSFMNTLQTVYYHPLIVNKNYRKSHRRKEHAEEYFISDSSRRLLKICRYSVVNKDGLLCGISGSGDHYSDLQLYEVSQHIDTVVYLTVDLTKLLYRKKMAFIFKIFENEMCKDREIQFYYGIGVDNKLSVIIDTRYGAESFPLEDIVNERWEDFQNGLPLLYEEVRLRKKAEYELRETNNQ